MNNTKNILLITVHNIITSHGGRSIIPMQSYADRDNNEPQKNQGLCILNKKA